MLNFVNPFFSGYIVFCDHKILLLQFLMISIQLVLSISATLYPPIPFLSILFWVPVEIQTVLQPQVQVKELIFTLNDPYM